MTVSCLKCAGDVVSGRCMQCLWRDTTRVRPKVSDLMVEMRAQALKQVGAAPKPVIPAYCPALIGVKGCLTSVCYWCGLTGDTI